MPLAPLNIQENSVAKLLLACVRSSSQAVALLSNCEHFLEHFVGKYHLIALADVTSRAQRCVLPDASHLRYSVAQRYV